MKHLLIFALLFSNFAYAQNAEKLKTFYAKLDKNSLHLVEEFYAKDIHFFDPVGEVKGVVDMTTYYKHMYKNAESVKFDFSQVIESGDTVVAIWNMTLKTDKLNGGEPFSVEGNSVVKFGADGKAVYHRDYFDMGAFIYERIPVMGFFVRKIKKRMEVH